MEKFCSFATSSIWIITYNNAIVAKTKVKVIMFNLNIFFVVQNFCNGMPPTMARVLWASIGF